MTRIKNEDEWSAVEDLAPLRGDGGTGAAYDRAWEYLAKLQSGGRLNKLDILRLEILLAAVYSLGMSAQKSLYEEGN